MKEEGEERGEEEEEWKDKIVGEGGGQTLSSVIATTD